MDREYEPWRYFLDLEKVMLDSETFCAISTKNFTAYSNKYAEILILSSIHFEYCAKLYIREKDKSVKTKGMKITDIHGLVRQIRPGMATFSARLRYYDIQHLRPLSEWDSETYRPLPWWQAYNDIKHDFVANIRCATQKNALLSLSACLCILLYYFEGLMQYIPVHTTLFYYAKPKFWVTSDGYEVLP